MVEVVVGGGMMMVRVMVVGMGVGVVGKRGTGVVSMRVRAVDGVVVIGKVGVAGWRGGGGG